MAEPTDRRDAVRKIAWRIGLDDYPTGSLAALRRLRPEAPDGAAFWWLVAEYAPSAFGDDRASEALATVVQGMAIAHPFHRPLSGRGGLGEALAEAGVVAVEQRARIGMQAVHLNEFWRAHAALSSSFCRL